MHGLGLLHALGACDGIAMAANDEPQPPSQFVALERRSIIGSPCPAGQHPGVCASSPGPGLRSPEERLGRRPTRRRARRLLAPPSQQLLLNRQKVLNDAWRERPERGLANH